MLFTQPPAHNVADLFAWHIDALKREARDKGRLQQLLADYLVKVSLR